MKDEDIERLAGLFDEKEAKELIKECKDANII